MQSLPKFKEEYSSKLPALTLLTNLGWQFYSPDEALAARGNKTSEVVLHKVLRAELAKRRFNFAGKSYPLSASTIDNLVNQLTSPALNEGLLKANEKIYNSLLYGIAVTEFIDGKRANPTIPIIDWDNLSNNSFIFTEEFTVTRLGSNDNRRPDIVCFVNGLPLVVIEAKRPVAATSNAPTIEEGISQSIRNQRTNEIPQLFAYSQLLLSINGNEGRYGTCLTPLKFWASWREEDFTDEQMLAIKNQPLSNEQLEDLFHYRSKADLSWYTHLIEAGELAITGQDKLLISLLTPARLFEFIRFFTLFDTKAGKIVARYQQVFGIKKLLERISGFNPEGGREGGVIWHTTGSGKSYTMVLLSKTLLLHPNLKNCRLIVITDRVDLETQLSDTFASGGELASRNELAEAKAASGRDLALKIGKGNERIIFSLIQKFNSAIRHPECHNPSKDLIVLVDEGHRSQQGENHIRMRQALPKASFIAFTDTLLLKDDKTTNKFGSIVHAYTMQRAVEDKTVTPLLYEERIPELNVNETAIDAWFDRITMGLSEEQQADLKRKFSRKGVVYSADDRIRLIALDLANHFTKHITDGLKGQLACASKADAIRYKKYLDEAGLFESAVVISPPDTREGNTAVDETAIPEVTRWWQENVGSQDEGSYTKNVIQRFDTDPDLKLLIVVDKLLTGFDEPKNAVLYIDKPLREHNLVQAIARVNHLHPLKEFGLLIDYRGILAELDTAITDYQNLAERTQGGYDLADIDGLYSQVNTQYKQLPLLYKQLWAIFAGVKNKNDTEQLRQVLMPKMQEREGQLLDTNLKTRHDFYDALSAFASCLKIALQSASFFEDTSFTDKERNHYKDTLKEFTSLRQLAQQDAGEKIDYDEYTIQVKKLIDKHVAGIGVREAEGAYAVNDIHSQEEPENWSEEKTRNETDLIKTRVAKMIEQELSEDPYAQQAFSELLKAAIEEAEQQFDHPLKQYLIFCNFEEQVKQRRLKDVPETFADNPKAQAYYGLFKIYLPQVFAIDDEQVIDKWIKLAFQLDELVQDSLAVNSINPQNLEADLRKRLLPLLFAECKAVGTDMAKTKKIIEHLIQLVRLGLANA